MKFYLFTSDFNLIKTLENLKWDGVLHTYHAYQENPFINIAKNITQDTQIKHMVAIRPYTISPQYLCTITDTISNIIGQDKIQINFISGWIKEEESDAGGFVGDINDRSSNVDRGNYLIEYIHVLEKLNRNIPDYYISVTNNFTFELAKIYNSKIIIDYSHFKQLRYDLKDMKVMVSMGNLLLDHPDLSHEEFFNIVDNIKSQNIQEIIFPNQKNTNLVIDLVNRYKQRENK
jgi:hypothetical protein